MSKQPILALIGGAAGGALWLLVPVVSPLPLFAAGLGLGTSWAVLAAAVAAAIAVLVSGAGGALYCAVALLAPVLVLVRQALLTQPGDSGDLQWYPSGQLAVCLTGLGAAMVIIAVLLAGMAGEAGAEAWVRAAMEHAIRAFGIFSGAAHEGQMNMVLDLLAPLAPGMAVATWLVLLVLNASVAQKLLVNSGRNLRPVLDLTGFRLPAWMPLAPLAAAGLAFVASGDVAFAARNLALIALVPYFLTGIAVVHVVSRSWPARGLFLAGFYAIVFLFGWPASILLMVLGLLEHWMNWRAPSGRGPATGGGGPQGSGSGKS